MPSKWTRMQHRRACLTTSRRHPCRLLQANYPAWSPPILHKEALGLDRKPHLDAALWVPLLHEAQRPLDALSLNPHHEVGGSTAYLHRNLHHLRSALSSSIVLMWTERAFRPLAALLPRSACAVHRPLHPCLAA